MKKVSKKKVSKKKVSKKKRVVRRAVPARPAGEIERRFNYYAPDYERTKQHGKMREAMKRAAKYVQKNAPECRERSLAFTKLEEAMFWANAAIARPKGDN